MIQPIKYVAGQTLNLGLPHIGEEAMYSIVTQEMWFTQEFLVTTRLLLPYGRPPLYSWLILVPAWLIGFEHILIAARIVTIAATVATGLVLAWLIQRLSKSAALAALSAALFLSGDVLIYRGWLSYSDPLFVLFVVSAVACLWIAVEERRSWLIVLAVLALAGSFLTKVVLGYVFYGLFALVLLWRHPNRGFLFSPVSILLHAAVLAFPFAWDYLVGARTVVGPLVFHGTRMLAETHGEGFDWLRLIEIPTRLFWYLLPGSAIALFCLWRYRAYPASPPVTISVWTSGLNFLPYWLFVQRSGRYLLPLYPLLAFAMASVILNAPRRVLGFTLRMLWIMVGIALLTSLIVLPLYERQARGDYRGTAQEIVARAGDQPIYAATTTSIALSVIANINILRHGQRLVTPPPPDWENGWLIAREGERRFGSPTAIFSFGRRQLLLICRGEACGATATTNP